MAFRRLFLEAIAFYARNTPIEKGRWRLMTWGRALARKMTHDKPRTVRTRRGFMMRTRLNDYVPREIFLLGEWEPDTTRLLASSLKNGDVFLDIGANVGYFAVFAGRLVGEKGKVFAFEPLPEVRAELEHNISLNRLSNCRVMPFAASDRAENITLHVPEGILGNTSMRSQAKGREIQAQAARVDDLLGDQQVSMVKVDIEGAEHLALSGMEKILRRDKPQLIVEVTDSSLREFGSSAEKLGQFLVSLGYEFHRLNETGHPTPISIEEFSRPQQFFNAWCVARKEH